MVCMWNFLYYFSQHMMENKLEKLYELTTRV